jgi:ATP-dependent DNA helicase RecG
LSWLQSLSKGIPVPDVQLKFKFSSHALMSVNELYANLSQELLSELAEDRRIERKPPGFHARSLGDYISMWANTPPDGGLVVIGIEDDGGCTGLTSFGSTRLNELERANVEFVPDARSETKRLKIINSKNIEDFVLVLRVFYRPDRVVRTVSGESFIRVADQKRKLKEDEVRLLEIDKGQIDFEQEPSTQTFPEDFDLELIHEFAESVRNKKGLNQTHSDAEILEQRRLGCRETKFAPNIACELLFAKDPARRFPGCKLRFLRFDGEEERTGEKFNAVKDIWVEGSVPKVILQAENVLDSQLRTFNRLGSDGKFYTAPEYPKPVWYEAVVNACVHRSYALRNMYIFVKMFDDRLVIESPGGLPPLVTPENIYDVHHPRNPHLMDAMYYLDFVKAANEGTRRMRDLMSQEKLPKPEFKHKEQDHPILRVILRNNIKQRKVWIDSDAAPAVGAAIAETLTQNQRRAINFVAEHAEISVSQLQRLVNKSWPTAKRILVALEARGVLVQRKRRSKDRDPQARYVLAAKIRK